MSTPMLVQALVLALLLGWSALVAARRLFPDTTRRAQARAVAWFDRPSSPAWLHALAQRLQPTATTGASCADGCSSCGGCGSSKAPPAVVAPIPLVFRPPSS
jgi:hypothetical protein